MYKHYQLGQYACALNPQVWTPPSFVRPDTWWDERRKRERRRGEESQSRSSRENRRGCRTRCEGLRCKSAPHPSTAQPNRDRRTTGISALPSSSRRLQHPPDCSKTGKKRTGNRIIVFLFCILQAFRALYPDGITRSRKDDVHEQQTASFRHASHLTWAQVHNSALELGGDQESLSASSTGKRAANFSRSRPVSPPRARSA